MKKFRKVLINGFNKSEIDPIYWKRINKLSNKIVWLPLNSSKIKLNLKKTDCLLVKFNPPVPKEWIDIALDLKYIGAFATSYGKIDCQYAAKKKTVVTNVPGFAVESVAEFVFATVLEQIRDLDKAKQQAQNGNFDETSFSAYELKNKLFGVIGAGAIGSRVLFIAKGFSCNPCYWNRNRKENLKNIAVYYEDINKLIKLSDFLSIHLALNQKTAGFFDLKKINLIKRGAIVINTAPMELFDIPALILRLEKNDFTFIWDHPDETNQKYVKKLLKLPNCITYPPIGYISNEAMINKQEIFVSNLENFLKGKITNKVN